MKKNILGHMQEQYVDVQIHEHYKETHRGYFKGSWKMGGVGVERRMVKIDGRVYPRRIYSFKGIASACRSRKQMKINAQKVKEQREWDVYKDTLKFWGEETRKRLMNIPLYDIDDARLEIMTACQAYATCFHFDDHHRGVYFRELAKHINTSKQNENILDAR